MSIIKPLLSVEFSKYMNDISTISEENSHLPTKYEGNITKNINKFFNFIWCGKDGNTASTDAVTKEFSALEIKGSDPICIQQLNSTTLCRFIKYTELCADTQKILSTITNKSFPELKYWVLPKEYLFIIKKFKTAIYIDPKICSDSSYTYTESLETLLSFSKNAHECEANQNNKIVQNYDFKDKLSLQSKNESFITLRHRAMYGFDLPKLLEKYNLTKIAKEAASIVFTTPNNFQKNNLTTLSHLIHYQDNNLIILVNKK